MVSNMVTTTSSSSVSNENNNNNNNNNRFKQILKLKKYVTVEPIIILYFLPGYFLSIGMANFELEKICRVNLGMDAIICNNLIDHELNNINCTDFIKTQSFNSTIQINENVTNEFYLSSLRESVCSAEIESQKIFSIMNGYRGVLVAIFPLIIILFAGGWSDKKGIRKPCILYPLIGEVFAVISLLISAIFMNEIPMEFASVLSRLLPSMSGGSTLFLMGIFSYLTAITTEEERTFRFGIITIISIIVPVISLPLSAFLYYTLGYVNLFIFGTLIYVISVVYCIFVLEEIPKIPNQIQDTKTKNGCRINAGFECNELSDKELKGQLNKIKSDDILKTNDKSIIVENVTEKKNIFVEFFDPTLALNCIHVFTKKRDNNVRMILFLLAASYFLSVCSTGENDYLYLFGRIKVGWEAKGFNLFYTYTAFLGAIGSLITVSLFSVKFKMSDSMIGIMSTIFTIASKPIFAFASTITMFYIATTVDLFFGLRILVLKTIVSRLVDESEVGRVYSIFGLCDAIPILFISEIYTIIYTMTVETFIGTIYLFGIVFLLPVLFIFIYLYIKLKKIPQKTQFNSEITHL